MWLVVSSLLLFFYSLKEALWVKADVVEDSSSFYNQELDRRFFLRFLILQVTYKFTDNRAEFLGEQAFKHL